MLVARCIAGRQVQVTGGIQPQRIGALIRVAIALVDEGLPVAAQAVGAKPGLEAHRAQQVGVGRVRHLDMARFAPERLELHGPADHARDGFGGINAKRHARRDVVAVVADLEQLEAVADVGPVLRVPDAAFDDQRVGSAERIGLQIQIVEARRADDLAAELIEQAPRKVVAITRADAQRLAVEVVARTRDGTECIDVGLVGRIERARHHRVDSERCGVGDVEQAERVVAGLVADRVDDQLVVAGDQVQQRAGAAEFLRLRAVPLPAVDLGAARADQAPAEVGDVVVRRQCVEQQRLVPGQAEGVDRALARLRNRAAGGRAERQGSAEVVDLAHVEAVAARRRAVAILATLDEQQVGARYRDGERALVVLEGGAAEKLVAVGVDQAVDRLVVAAVAQHVEEQLVADRGVELVDVAFEYRVEHATDRCAGADGTGLGARIAQLERETAGVVAAAADRERVRTRGQRDHRVGAVELVRVTVAEVARDDRAVGAGQCPGQVAAAVERVEIQRSRAGEVKGVDLALPR